MRNTRTNDKAFTLVELLVALALMAVIIPVIYQALNVATLAGEVSQRKAMAARIAERILNETIVTGQAQSAQSGVERSGPYDFRWVVKDEPWTQLGGLTSLNSPNGVNSSGLSQNNIHQLSVDVTYTAQSRDFSVHLSTLVNITAQ
jgi:prepilin-type N-terminal cleavage/methylation domain-containing protein